MKSCSWSCTASSMLSIYCLILIFCRCFMLVKREGVFVLETRDIVGDARHRVFTGECCLCFRVVSKRQYVGLVKQWMLLASVVRPLERRKVPKFLHGPFFRVFIYVVCDDFIGFIAANNVIVETRLPGKRRINITCL